MVVTLVTNATMVTVLPRCWCFYNCCGAIVAIANKVPVVTFATVFTRFSGVHWLVGVGLSARSFSLCGLTLSHNFQYLYRPDSHLNTSR
jgi:hypothetical protein